MKGCEYIVIHGEPDRYGRTLVHHYWMIDCGRLVLWRAQVSRRSPGDRVMRLPRKEVGPCKMR
jgi:hypothetical protein